jgi:uncharacterized protein CbrC (UPF0167 family)
VTAYLDTCSDGCGYCQNGHRYCETELPNAACPWCSQDEEVGLP